MTPTPAWAAYDGGTITAEVDRRLALHAAAVLTPDCPDLPAEENPMTTLHRAWAKVRDAFDIFWTRKRCERGY